MTKKNNLLLLACRSLGLCLLKDQALPTTLLSFEHQLGSYSLHKRETVTTELLLLNGHFWVNFPVFCIELFSSTNDPAIAIAPRSVESWWSLRNEMHSSFRLKT